MSQNISDESQTPAEQPTGADLIGKMTDATKALLTAQENLVKAAADVAKHTTDPNAHGAATLANIAKAMPTPVLEDGMFTFKDAAGKPLMEPVNIKGDPGEQGEKGEDGDKGDMPDHRWNGTALQVQKPDGSWGDEQDLQGPKGLDGADGAPGLAPAHEWNGTSLKFKNPDGTWGEEQNLQGPKGEDGAPGQMPDHQWNGTSLQIQNPDGSWGEPQNLKGEKGDPGDSTIATVEQPGAVQPDGVTTTVDEDGLLSALGGNLLLNDETWLTESGTFTALATGWHEVLCIDGGHGAYATYYGVIGGDSGGLRWGFAWLVAGEEYPVTVGAGGNPITSPGSGVNTAGGQTTFAPGVFEDMTPTYPGGVPENDMHNSQTAFRAGEGTVINQAGSYHASGAGLGGGVSLKSTAENAGRFFGAGGCAWWSNGVSYAAKGAQGAVRLRFWNRAKDNGQAPVPATFAARRMTPRAAAAPVTVNLYDPETGMGSVWREEDAEAKLAEGMISEAAWLEIRAEKAAEARAAWLADPDTEAERFALLRGARDARLAVTDYLVAPDYPLTDEQRAAVISYRQALRDLPAQEGAPWDGGGELTPWPEMPAVSKAQVEPDEPEQTEEPEV